MRKSLILFLLICACCAHRQPSSAGQALSDALLVRADTYKAGCRYLEALSLYRDIAMNPAWAERAGAPLYLSMAGIYRGYLGDTAQADLWYGRYQALSPGLLLHRPLTQGLLQPISPCRPAYGFSLPTAQTRCASPPAPL